MNIRKYRHADCPILIELFYETVHAIPTTDYTKEQLDAWATGCIDMEKWDRAFCGHSTFVAEHNGEIVGFSDMDGTGYLDRLYVHRDHQKKGIGAALVLRLEENAMRNGLSIFEVHASITARPFFERQGYTLIRDQAVVRNGIVLKNYVMKKEVNGGR
ncbi:MAG: GNAT family N-acetyltransferase [Clostridia bacterium]